MDLSNHFIGKIKRFTKPPTQVSFVFAANKVFRIEHSVLNIQAHQKALLHGFGVNGRC